MTNLKLATKLSLFNTIAAIVIVVVLLFLIYNFFAVSVMKSITNEFINADRFVTVIETPFGTQYIVRKWDMYVASSNEKIVINDPYGIGYVDAQGIKGISDRYFYFVKLQPIILGRDVTPSILFINMLRRIFIIAIIVLAAFVFFANYYISKRSVRDIKEFVNQIEALGGRDVSFRVAIKPKSVEVAELVSKFNDLMERIEAAYKSQESFVSAVSHELRTPVASLMGYVNMLRRWGLKDEEILNESINAIEESSKEIKEIIENMLLIAKVETLTREPIDLFEFTDEIVRQRFKGKDISIEGQGVTESNKEGLGIIISILLSNAFAHGQPPVEIKISNDRIDVINHGPKIPEEDLQKIFNRFYKGKDSQGTGLGLYIAGEISKKIGMEIKVDSNDERTIFSIVSLKSTKESSERSDK